HMVSVTPFGVPGLAPVVGTALTVAPGVSYTLFAMGQDGLAPHLLALADEPVGVNGYQAGVRFVNASPDTRLVDVAVPGGPVLAGNVAFGQASPYFLLPAG